MQIFRSYILLLFTISVVCIAYYYGGFWCASTFFLLGSIFLMWLLAMDELRFSKPTPRWKCGTPGAVRKEIDEHYSNAVSLVKENKSVTCTLLEEKLHIDDYLASKIIGRLVEENILIEKTERIWGLKN